MDPKLVTIKTQCALRKIKQVCHRNLEENSNTWAKQKQVPHIFLVIAASWDIRSCGLLSGSSKSRTHIISTWMFPKMGMGPQSGWFTMENPIKMDDLGVSLFLETPTSIIFFFWKDHLTDWHTPPPACSLRSTPFSSHGHHPTAATATVPRYNTKFQSSWRIHSSHLPSTSIDKCQPWIDLKQLNLFYQLVGGSSWWWIMDFHKLWWIMVFTIDLLIS